MKVALGCSLAILLSLPVAWLAAQDSFAPAAPGNPALPSEPGSPGVPAVIGTRAAAPLASQQPMRPETATVLGLQSQYRNAVGVVQGVYFSREDQAAMELAMQFRRTDDESLKEDIRKQLLALTQSAFKKKMDERAKQVEEAQARLDKIKAEIEQRKELEEKIIARRVADLLDDPDPLAWDADQPGQRDQLNLFLGRRLDTDQSGYTTPTFPIAPSYSRGFRNEPLNPARGQLPPTAWTEPPGQQAPASGRSTRDNPPDLRRESGAAVGTFSPDSPDL